MAKNTFKKAISDRYKGRGNSWVRVPFESKAYDFIKDILDNTSETVTAEYIKNINREGYAWIRYKKVTGDETNPLVLFEVRLKGSKIDQPEYSIEIPDIFVKELALLGNTPYKLQLETENKKLAVAKKKQKPEIKATIKKDEELANVAKSIRKIKEAALTKPTSYELRSWYEFLKVNDIYEESKWQ